MKRLRENTPIVAECSPEKLSAINRATGYKNPVSRAARMGVTNAMEAIGE